MSLPNHLLEQLLTICRVPSARDALVEAIKSGGGDLTADEIAYDNAESGLSAEDLQAAVDELASSGSGANTTLSNLGTVALNTVLQPASAGGQDLGSETYPFAALEARQVNLRNNGQTIFISQNGTHGIIGSTTGLISFEDGARLADILNPVNPQDAATKDYVDDLVTGASGSFTTVDSKTVTVVNGLITSIV